MQRTELLTAQTPAILVNMRKDIIKTLSPYNLVRRPSGNPFSRFAPVEDIPILVTDV
jgi:hypothetical protein